MSKPISILLKKEYLYVKRGSLSLRGLVLFGALFVLLLCFLLREIGVNPQEVGLISFSGLWLITLFTCFRYSLQAYREESERDIFCALLDSGYSAEKIFYSKLLFAILILLVMGLINFSLFTVLIGFPEILSALLCSYVVFLMAIPGLAILGSIGAIVSLVSKQEEIIMGITVVPLSLYYGVLVVSEAELAFSNRAINLTSHGLLSVIGMSVILFLVTPILSRSVFNSNRVI